VSIISNSGQQSDDFPSGRVFQIEPLTLQSKGRGFESPRVHQNKKLQRQTANKVGYPMRNSPLYCFYIAPVVLGKSQ
jgi:hypothetical protein